MLNHHALLKSGVTVINSDNVMFLQLNLGIDFSALRVHLSFVFINPFCAMCKLPASDEGAGFICFLETGHPLKREGLPQTGEQYKHLKVNSLSSS